MLLLSYRERIVVAEERKLLKIQQEMHIELEAQNAPKKALKTAVHFPHSP